MVRRLYHAVSKLDPFLHPEIIGNLTKDVVTLLA